MNENFMHVIMYNLIFHENFWGKNVIFMHWNLIIMHENVIFMHGNFMFPCMNMKNLFRFVHVGFVYHQRK